MNSESDFLPQRGPTDFSNARRVPCKANGTLDGSSGYLLKHSATTGTRVLPVLGGADPTRPKEAPRAFLKWFYRLRGLISQ